MPASPGFTHSQMRVPDFVPTASGACPCFCHPAVVAGNRALHHLALMPPKPTFFTHRVATALVVIVALLLLLLIWYYFDGHIGAIDKLIK